LVEVVTAAQSSPNAVAKGLALTRKIRKLPLPCRSHPGFLVNRTLAPYMAEAMELLREGVPATVIDQAAVDFGMPVGPLELVDSVGADIALNAARILAPVVGRPVAPELEEMVSAGHLGQKTGQGFYTYPAGRPKPEQRPASPAVSELTDRLILTLLNEAVASFADGVVDNAGLVDAGIIFGTGFAPFRGGPIQYAKQRGIDDVIDALGQLENQHGERFRPSRGWQAL